MEFVLKRIYDPASPEDGYRVLVDRLWPRGVKKADADISCWAKEITPSPDLRKWFHEDREGRFKTFSERYAKELEDSPAVGEFIRSIPEGTDRVTLLYAAKAGAPSHVGTLKAALEKAAAAISLKNLNSRFTYT